MRHCNYCSKC